MTRVALLFIDGVGVGKKSADVNPLARGQFLLSRFSDAESEPLPHGGLCFTVDTTFGVKGRPQSASNQTAMLTGEPAPKLVGRHVLGFPDAPLRKLLLERSIVRRIAAAGGEATFANCYPAGYLDALGLKRRASAKPEVEISERARRRLKPSATTCAFAAAEVALRTLSDAREGDGLTHDIFGHRARKHGFDVPQHSPKEAAQVFWRVADGKQFTLFEHYLADEAGHKQDAVLAEEALREFDLFAREVVAQRPDDAIVVICSDHGNVEDLSIRNHTLAEVPVLVFGGPGIQFGAGATVADIGVSILSCVGAA